MVSLLYVFSHASVDTKVSESLSRQAVIRIVTSRTYPLCGQPGGFSKCPCYHSISPTYQSYTFSLLKVFSHASVDTKISESLSRQAVIRIVSSRRYPLYAQPGGFSKCPFYHSISHIHHIYMVSLMYVFSHASRYQDKDKK